MTRLQAFVYCIISFTFGMLLMFVNSQFSYIAGSINRGAHVVSEERDFWEAMINKVPYEKNGYKFMPHTHEKKILVVRSKRP